MINYIPYGNIFNIKGVTSYAHGCNCVGAMGKGIAVQFRHKFPDMFIIYHEMCQKKKFCPGDVYAYEYEPGKFVFNLATQEHYNPRFGRLARIEWISTSVEKMIKIAEENGVTDIALPKIGAGLGGLIWGDVKRVIEEVASDSKVTLHVVEEYLA